MTRLMKWHFFLVLLLGFGLAAPAMAADVDGDGIDDNPNPFVDVNGDGIDDSLRSAAGVLIAAETDSSSTRDVLIVHESRPLAYFGWYRVSQMTPPGFDLLQGTIDWLVGSKAPADTRLVLFTYSGSLDPDVYQEADGLAVYNYLVNAGYTDIEVRHQKLAASLPPSHYDDFDAVLYWNSYPYDPTNILDSGIPFVSSSLGHTAQMGIATGSSTLHEFRDTTYVTDNTHPITAPYPLGALTLASRMWTDASQAAGSGRALVVADPLPVALDVEIDIRPWSEHNLIYPFSQLLIPVALFGLDGFDVANVDVGKLAFGPSEAPPAFDLSKPSVVLFSRRDVNGDGEEDLLSYYRTEETGIPMGDTEACLTGEMVDGTPFEGCDAITTRPACGHGFEAALVVLPLVCIGGRVRRRR
jgi:hypothetical protein